MAVYSRLVVADETLIIVQTRLRTLEAALRIAASVPGDPPLTFAFPPGRSIPVHSEVQEVQLPPMTVAAMREAAEKLARSVRSLAPRSSRPRPLHQRLADGERRIVGVRETLAQMARLGIDSSLAAEWLLDNAHVIAEPIREFRHNLPRSFCRQLPVIPTGRWAGLPRVYGIAAEIVSDTDARLDQTCIQEFVASFQTVTPLAMGEIWALPQMLRLCLVETIGHLATQVERRELERVLADFWANRLLAAARREPGKVPQFMFELSRRHPEPTAHLAHQLMDYLFDEETALAPARAWLNEALADPLPAAQQQESVIQAAEQVALANAIGSLRLLANARWEETLEALSATEAILRNEPAGAYAAMEFATRDRYRHEVEALARRARTQETTVASAAVDLASGSQASPADHAGYYLIDDGREALESRLQCRPSAMQSVRRWTERHAAQAYVSCAALGTAATLAGLAAWCHAMGVGAGAITALMVIGVAPASELAVQALNLLAMRMMPPRFVPKMDFRHGLPDDCRTLVVIPMMLLTPESILAEVEHLRARFLANSDDNLLYALLSDYSDAPRQSMPEDAELLDVAADAIRQMNAEHGPGRFFLFHRERRLNDSEGRWIGWERKRGKLEELNRYLCGEAAEAGLLRVGAAEDLRDIRFVITLDSDTQLPRDAARRLVGAMAHPLNRPHIAADGRSVVRGCTIIQPRVTTSLPSATATRFSMAFSDPTGMDPYTKAVSDAFHDLAGEGSYHGKGIYDLRAFHALLSGRLPENHILSHDLLEGAHVGVRLASDIELLDQFPADFDAYRRRVHRWTRGDWQITDWIWPVVPGSCGRRERNPLSPLSRWKIADNLRRSMIAPTAMALLTAAWLIPGAESGASALVWAVLALPPLLALLARVTGLGPPCSARRRELLRGAARALVEAAMLPHMAVTALDAMARAEWRRRASHALLLEWETAQQVQRKSRSASSQTLQRMIWATGLSAAAAWAMMSSGSVALANAAPFLTLWAIAPWLAGWLGRPDAPHLERPLTEPERHMLRKLASDTWRYFADFTGPATNWLPPDNVQEPPSQQVAERTSPTNIGLGLLANLAALDFGFITPEEAVDRTAATLATLGKLELYEGHLLNWYDTRTLAPLRPRYVSMVDSGNLLAALWATRQALEELIHRPILGAGALAAVREALAMPRTGQPAPHPDDLGDLCRALRSAAKADHAAEGWEVVIHRFLPWVAPLEAPPSGGLLVLGSEAHEWRRQALAAPPTLMDLAEGRVPGLAVLVATGRRAERSGMQPDLRQWQDELADAAEHAQAAAHDLVARARSAIADAETLADGMDMRFLYDPERRLFRTGYNVSERRMDPGYYDLLASEARLGSFVAIARGDAPTEHWWALGRPQALCAGRSALQSWNGSMFEYLMPLVLTKSFRNSLLDKGCRDAVYCQIAYGRARRLPWGISEAAFSAIDANQVYQYRAFGIPGLGLKHGLEADLVVAPYASALALMINAPAAARNLREMASMPRHPMRGDYGFRESLDFTREQEQGGGWGVVVHTYMAHHQGMILAALDNALNDGILQTRFHRDPRVRATEHLLFERIAVARAAAPNLGRAPVATPLEPPTPAPVFGQIGTPDTPIPRTNLLSNGSYSVMVTSAGGGWSRRHDLEITRWRADTTRDALGAFIYLRDLDSCEVWSSAHQPVQAQPDRYAVTFAVDKAEFRRRDAGIEAITEIVVSPEHDVEVRRVTLVNRTFRRRRIELTSYAELAMAPHNADRAHPAFSKMFVETEALTGHRALLARRRPRSSSEEPCWALHVLAAEPAFDADMRFETDRALFVGRGRSPSAPAAMEGDLSGSAGAVMDPIFSLRAVVELEPGRRVEAAFITGAVSSREEALELVEKYSDISAAQRAQTMAWTHAQLEMRRLRIHPEDAHRFQQLAAYVLYPNVLLRPSQAQLARNLLGQSRLWPYGISGDLPIVVATISQVSDMQLVREVIIAHSYWAARGLKTDLVILNEEPSTYDQTAQEALRRMIDALSQDPTEGPGGIFLRQADAMAPEDRSLLLTSARAVLVAARGPLSQQLGAPRPPGATPPPFEPVASEPEARPMPLAPVDLALFNGIGGFADGGREYVICLKEGGATPHPWVNVMANPTFGTLASECGSGFTWQGNSQQNRITPWSNDPVTDPPGEGLYLRDEATGAFWTPTALPVREAGEYRARHGQGYSVFEHNSHGLEQEMTVFVPVDGQGGAPVRVQRLRLCNRSGRPRTLSATFCCRLVLGAEREETQLHLSTQWDGVAEMLLARNPYHPDFGTSVAFVAGNLPVESYTGDIADFLGRNGVPARPAAMRRTRLAGRVGSGLDACAGLQVRVDIEPDETVDVVFLLGQAQDAGQARALARRFRASGAVDAALQATKEWWDGALGALHVETPDPAANLMLNRWLIYQALSCRLWGRSGFYQSGGAFGFRDQLQDALALLYADPAIARAQILRAATRQFVEGDVQHWWHEPSGAGVRTRITDDLLWLPFVTAQYVRVTGDAAILDEVTPFLETDAVPPSEPEAYGVPRVSATAASLLDHCGRAVARGWTTGPHGLPLMGGGDWNDGLNRVGIGGKGESVWLGWFLVRVLTDYAELLDLRGRTAEAADHRVGAADLTRAIDREAWDGRWYLRAFYDDGAPVGSAHCAEGQIDSIAQSWSVLSGAPVTEHTREAVQAVGQRLVWNKEQMVLLFAPAFDKTDRDPGYIKGYLPGIRENGGQYTHGVLWYAQALARLGDGGEAVRILQMLSPIAHSGTPEEVATYRVEPYVVAADIYAAAGRVGQGGWTWYTGAAGVMYRAWIEDVLGFRLRGDVLTLDPTLPEAWPGFTLTFRRGGTTYRLEVVNPEGVSHGVRSVEIDGRPAPDLSVTMAPDGLVHAVRVVMGRPA